MHDLRKVVPSPGALQVLPDSCWAQPCSSAPSSGGLNHTELYGCSGFIFFLLLSLQRPISALKDRDAKGLVAFVQAAKLEALFEQIC